LSWSFLCFYFPGQVPPNKKTFIDPEQLEEDMNLLNEIAELSSKLKCTHSVSTISIIYKKFHSVIRKV